MKSLVAGIVLIILIGIGGFIYRNVQERTAGPTQIACTADAKICPDGSAVGRTGPACEFTPCVFPPNVEFASTQIAFALPEGYTEGVQEPGADGEVPGMLNFYQKQALGSVPHYITVYAFTIPAGSTAEGVMIENTLFSPSGEPAENTDKFEPVLINGRTFQHVVIERFEGQVVSAYYLPRANDVLRFDVMERDVTNWTDSGLKIESLPQHKALLQMLATLQP